MLEEFKDWVEAILGSQYHYAPGQWVDSEALNGSKICSIRASGGPRPDVEDRRPIFRVIVLGPRSARQAVGSIREDIYALAQAALGDSVPCGAAAISATGEPVGPGYTTENRAWFSLDFQITF